MAEEVAEVIPTPSAEQSLAVSVRKKEPLGKRIPKLSMRQMELRYRGSLVWRFMHIIGKDWWICVTPHPLALFP